MKLIGHAWVAVNSRPHGNEKFLILGSILPDIMYYTKNNPFDFEEIHEGGDKVYGYLQEIRPEYMDLGLGMLAHSKKMGADHFNLHKNLEILGYEGERVEEIRTNLMNILNVNYETAVSRVHNILELAVELRILKEHPNFVIELNKAVADLNAREDIKKILSDCFDKPLDRVSNCIDELFHKARPGYFKDAEGLASLWAELSQEFDPPPDKKELTRYLKQLHRGFDGKDKKFLDQCIKWTKNNLKKFVRSKT